MMKNKLIVQDNALTTARYEMTAIEKNIMYSLMSQIEDTDDPSKYYRISSSSVYDKNDRRLKNGEFEKAIQRLLTRVERLPMLTFFSIKLYLLLFSR